MELHSNWMTNASLFGVNYPKNLQLQEVINNFDDQRNYSNEGYLVTIDGTTTQVVIQGHINPINADNPNRKLFCPLSSGVHLGSIVIWNSRTYLVASKPESNQAYLSMKMLETNYTLKWKNESNQTISQVAIVENFRNQTDGIASGKINTYGDNELYVTLPSNINTQKIIRNYRFIVGNDAYYVSKVDGYTLPGLIMLTFKEDQSNNMKDDLINGIADNSEIIYTTSTVPLPSSDDHYIELSGSGLVKTNLTELFTATVYNDRIAVNEQVTWTIRNEDGTTNPLYITIASSNTNTCMVKGVNNLTYIGKWSVLKATLTTNPTIFDEIRIQLISII